MKRANLFEINNSDNVRIYFIRYIKNGYSHDDSLHVLPGMSIKSTIDSDRYYNSAQSIAVFYSY